MRLNNKERSNEACQTAEFLVVPLVFTPGVFCVLMMIGAISAALSIQLISINHAEYTQLDVTIG